jgi:RNA polymerase sigma-70 factor (sigma-E family)
VDDGGFDGYVAARGGALLRFAYLLCGDRHRSEDLVQSALVKTLRNWHSVVAADHPDAYVRRIVVREYLSWRRLRVSGEVLRELSDADRPPAASAPDPAGAQASRAAAWDLLSRLPPAQRAVLVLRYYEDLDDEAVARVLSCTASTVRSNAARGLAALRRLVPALDPEGLP